MTDDEMPIDATESMATQSRHALMLAAEANLLTYRWPVDMRQDAQVAQLRKELGADAQLPDNDGVFYLVYVTYGNPNAAGKQRRMPVLIPEGEVRSFVLALAVKEGPETARLVQFMPGTLPK
jgi:redox-sensitive bicupin YhaK (pirin superfamily)